MTTDLPRYNNEVSPEYLRNFDQPEFTKAQLAELPEDVRAVLLERDAQKAVHPAGGIYRIATEGSRSREGGVVVGATSSMSFRIEGASPVTFLKAARVGDRVTYPDGRSAQIVTGAGDHNGNLALVGSRLSNGDEIIDTLFSGICIVAREGKPMHEDFLPGVAQQANQSA